MFTILFKALVDQQHPGNLGRINPYNAGHFYTGKGKNKVLAGKKTGVG